MFSVRVTGCSNERCLRLTWPQPWAALEPPPCKQEDGCSPRRQHLQTPEGWCVPHVALSTLQVRIVRIHLTVRLGRMCYKGDLMAKCSLAEQCSEEWRVAQHSRIP